MIKVYINGKRRRLITKGEPISLSQELATLRREESDRLSKAEYEFTKVDRACVAYQRKLMADGR